MIPDGNFLRASVKDGETGPVPRFQFQFHTSEIKLKFLLLSPEASQSRFTWKGDKFDRFLSQLKPEMSFKLTFSAKYFDGGGDRGDVVEWLMKDLRFRDERGRADIFNFIVIEKSGSEEEMIFIPNWGAVNIVSSAKTAAHSTDNFLLPFSKLIGFGGDIATWKSDLNQFYLERSCEMISHLKNSKDHAAIRVPRRLQLATATATDLRGTFDRIDSVYHDPELLAAAYFPDEHKFAVYLPVYLPLILPVLMALVKELKERRRRKNKTKTKSD